VRPSKIPQAVISDADPFIHLDELGCLDVLTAFREVLVPKEVWREVRRHRPAALRTPGVPFQKVDIIPAPSAQLSILIQEFPIDVGEEEALRLMGKFSEATFLTDDAAARIVAQLLGYDVHGTIGLLILGWRIGLRSKKDIIAILKSIPLQSSLFVTKEFLKSVMGELRRSSS
jgi:predicted nucleic acid-binding protein